jgi:hypothetical protein
MLSSIVHRQVYAERTDASSCSIAILRDLLCRLLAVPAPPPDGGTTSSLQIK